jgi:PAS domain S-box-containing protein
MTDFKSNQNRRVLVIDDNHSIHEDFRKSLGPGTGDGVALDEAEAALFGEAQAKSFSSAFQIDSATQGKEGLERVQQALQAGRPYAMAFIDVRMPPGWDGIETTAKIWEVYPDLQVVICTAYSDYSWDEVIARVGQSDRLVILKKPFDNVEVLQLANALTAKWQLLQQVKSKTDDLERLVAQRTAELRKSEEHFRLIAENGSDLIAVVDTGGRHVYSSPSFEKQLGWKPEELVGQAACDRIHSEDQARVIAALQSCVQRGVVRVVEHRLQHKNGSWCTVEAHASPVRNACGEVEQIVVVARDSTERRQMEVQLRHAQKMESIGQLAAGIAHEINTPTQYIGDNTRFLKDAFADLHHVLQRQGQLLQAIKTQTVTNGLVAEVEKAVATADVEYLAGEIPKAIQQSLDGVERVAKIVRSMKDFSHPGTNEKTLVDLNRSIESTLTVCRNEWKYVAEMVTDFDPNLPPVSCLPGEINQTILNIVVNAAHAIGDVVGDAANGKGTITVATRRDGEWAEIRIRDTGAGIPEHVRARIFDPFFTTKGVGKGTGQGLAIAHNVVVEKHGGVITFETEIGRGTTFIIRLPLVAPSMATQEPAA